MIKVSNIKVREMAELITVKCPNCLKENTYIVNDGHKFSCVRHCLGCGAILEFECEEAE